MVVLVVLVALAWLGWRLTRHIFSFPIQLAGLLNDATRQRGPLDYIAGRTRVTGRFKDRPVRFFLQRSDEHQTGYLVVSTRVSAPDQQTISARSMSGTAHADPDLEKALFSLEGRHQLRIDVADGWLRAKWMPVGFFIFPGRFDPSKWTDVLENLALAANRLERRAHPTAAAAEPPGARPTGLASELQGDAADVPAFTSEPEPPRRPRRPGLMLWTAVTTLLIFVGLSMLLASVPLLVASGEHPAFARTTAIFAGILIATGAVTLFVLWSPPGLLINEREPPVEDARAALGGWLWLLLTTLVAVPFGLVVRLAPLTALWRDILQFLDDNDIWTMAGEAPELSGFVLVPVFGVLAVPALQLALVACVAAGALVLLSMLLAASPWFPRAYLVFVLLFAGLMLSAQFATGAAIEAGRYFEAHLEPAVAQDAVHAAIARYGEVLQDSANILALATLGLALWTPTFFFSHRVQRTFAERKPAR